MKGSEMEKMEGEKTRYGWRDERRSATRVSRTGHEQEEEESTKR